MAINPRMTYTKQAKTALLEFTFNTSSDVAYSYNNGIVSSPLRATVITSSYFEFIEVLRSTEIWVKNITLLLSPGLPVFETYGEGYNYNLAANTIDFSFILGNAVVTGQWDKNTNIISINPRPAYTITFKSFILLVDMYKRLVHK